MTVQLFSLSGNLQVGGTQEAKAGLEGVTAAGRQTAETLAAAEAAFKKMGMSGATLDSAMLSARRGLGIAGTEASVASGGFAAMAAQQGKAAAIAREMPTPVNAMTAAMGTATSGALAWSSGLANAEKQGLGFRRGLEESHGPIKKHNEGIMGSFESLKHLAEIYGIIKIAEFTKEAIEEAAALQELHQKTGASVEMLSVLTFAGKHAGIGAAELAMAFRGFGMALENLERDASPRAVQAFGKLGLSIKDFQGLNTDEKFALIVEALKHIPDGMEKSAIASDVLGRSATVLLPLVDELGRKGIPAMTEEARKFGAVISEKTAKDAHQLEIEITQLGFAFDKLERLAIPSITALVRALTELLSLKVGDWFRNTWRELNTVAAFSTGDFGAIRRAMFPNADKEPELAGDPAEMRAARALGKGRPFLPFKAGGKGGGGGSTDENPLGTEISLLKEKFELNRAGAGDLTRLFVLEGQLTKALDTKNLSMKEELKLARDLAEARKAIAAALPPLDAPDKLAGGQYAPVGQKGRLDMRGYIGDMVAPQPIGGKSTDAANKQWEDQLRAGENLKLQFANLGQNLGMAVANSFSVGLSAAFQGKNPFKAFGKAIIGAIGGIMVQMGQAMIAQGIIMTGLLPALSNPFTSGPALIAAGVLLSALGMTLGAIMQGSGGGGAGAGGSIPKDQITQIHLTADGAGGFVAPQAHHGQPIQVLGVKTAEGARILAEGTRTARRLGHKV